MNHHTIPVFCQTMQKIENQNWKLSPQNNIFHGHLQNNWSITIESIILLSNNIYINNILLNCQPLSRVELHIHLDGSLRMSTIWEISKAKVCFRLDNVDQGDDDGDDDQQGQGLLLA